MTLRHAALALLLTALLAGCICTPAAVPHSGPPSDEEIAQARRVFGYSEAPAGQNR